MAELHLDRDEIDFNALPLICMRCGAPATHTKRKKFSWYPPWVTLSILGCLLAYIILVRVLRKEMVLEVPLCEAHRYHWLSRALALPILLVMMLVGAGVAVAVLPDDLKAAALLVACLGLLVWLVCAAVAQETSIHPTEITDYTISLKGVSVEFGTAVQRVRRPTNYFGRPV